MWALVGLYTCFGVDINGALPYSSAGIEGIQGLVLVFAQSSSDVDSRGRLMLSVRHPHMTEWSSFLRVCGHFLVAHLHLITFLKA